MPTPPLANDPLSLSTLSGPRLPPRHRRPPRPLVEDCPMLDAKTVGMGLLVVSN
jgi:hypothetical protein